MNKKINISLVGTALMGLQHIKAISQSKKANLHSIVDISNNAKNLSKKYKIPLYSNVDKIVKQAKELKVKNIIINNAKKYSDTVVITGGEPLMWSMDQLTESLKKEGLKTHIETSGAYSFSGVWDWFCLSPKKTKLPLEEVYNKANELKIIVHNKSDFKFAEEHASKVTDECELFLQPEWSQREKMTELIVAYVMDHPKWKISLQTHKYLNIPQLFLY